MKISVKFKIAIILAMLAIAVVFGIANGAAKIPFSQLFLSANRQILYLRLLRIYLAMVAGSGLAVAGIALQVILKNPLAEPYLVGTSSGAGLGAVAVIMLGLYNYLPLGSFLGAILSVWLVYNIARRGGKVPIQSLILSGAVVSIALSGIIVFLVNISANEALHGLMWWLWGSLEVYDLKLLFLVSAIVISGIIVIYVFSQDLNAISIGEEEAAHLGIRTEMVKKLLLAVTSLITAAIVCVSGIIGFVGLVIPHMMRLIVGPNNRILIPSSCIAGAIFMILCDTVGRSLISPLEIPIGVITACIGAPVFIILLKTKEALK